MRTSNSDDRPTSEISRVTAGLGVHVTACSHGETGVTVVQNELNHSLQPINSRVVYARCSSPRVNVRVLMTECCTENVSAADSQTTVCYRIMR